MQHCDYYKPLSCFQDDRIEPFKLGYLGKSDEVGKWGKCLDLLDRLMSERNVKTKSKMILDRNSQENIESKSPKKAEKKGKCGRENINMISDDFDNVNRFEAIGNYGFAILSRKLMRWLIHFYLLVSIVSLIK